MLHLIYLLAMAIIALLVMRASIRQLPTWVQRRANPATRSRRLASFGALAGFMLFLVMGASARLPSPSTAATLRVLLGAGADMSFVISTACYDDFFLGILFGLQHPLLRRSRQWKLIGVLLLTAITLVCTWQALLAHEEETPERLYLIPWDNPWSLTYREICLVWCLVLMARTIPYRAFFRQVSQDPVARVSIFLAATANSWCVGALGIGVVNILVPASTPLASFLILLSRISLLLFLACSLMINRVWARHLWHLRALWRLAPLVHLLAPAQQVSPRMRVQYLATACFRPAQLRFLLRHQVIALLDARRRLGIITPAHELPVGGDDPVSQIVSYDDDAYQPWSEQVDLDRKRVLVERRLAKQEAEFLLQAVPAHPLAFSGTQLEVLLPAIPRALWYGQRVSYLETVASMLVAAKKRQTKSPLATTRPVRASRPDRISDPTAKAGGL
jgi:hypothetical protein